LRNGQTEENNRAEISSKGEPGRVGRATRRTPASMTVHARTVRIYFIAATIGRAVNGNDHPACNRASNRVIENTGVFNRLFWSQG